MQKFLLELIKHFIRIHILSFSLLDEIADCFTSNNTMFLRLAIARLCYCFFALTNLTFFFAFLKKKLLAFFQSKCSELTLKNCSNSFGKIGISPDIFLLINSGFLLHLFFSLFFALFVIAKINNFFKYFMLSNMKR